MNAIYKKLLTKMIHYLINILTLCFVVIVSIVTKGSKCGGGGQPVSARFFCEYDMMGATWSLDFYTIFNAELKKANPSRVVTYWPDSLNLAPVEWLDERNGEVSAYLNAHRTITDTITGYDSKFYVCGVRYIIGPHGDTVGGLSFWSSTIQGEGMSAVAAQRIADLWSSHHAPEMLYLYIASATAHEIGHLFNMGHCGNDGCIMQNEINCIGNVHKKFCSSCSTKIATNIP